MNFTNSQHIAKVIEPKVVVHIQAPSQLSWLNSRMNKFSNKIAEFWKYKAASNRLFILLIFWMILFSCCWSGRQPIWSFNVPLAICAYTIWSPKLFGGSWSWFWSFNVQFVICDRRRKTEEYGHWRCGWQLHCIAHPCLCSAPTLLVLPTVHTSVTSASAYICYCKCC